MLCWLRIYKAQTISITSTNARPLSENVFSPSSINGEFRDECLFIEWFRSRREAAVLIEAWRNHYNEVRPHSRLQYLTPAEFKIELRKEPQPAIFQE